MGFKEDYESKQQEVETAVQSAKDAQSWFQFLAAHREIVNCEANFQMAKEMVESVSRIFDLANLEACWEDLSFRRSLGLQTLEEDRSSALAELQAALQARGGGQFTVESEFRRYSLDSTLTPEAIRALAASIVGRTAMSKLSTSEVRRIANQRSPEPAASTLGPEWTRKAILKLSVSELKDLNRRFTHEQVNSRIAGLS